MKLYTEEQVLKAMNDYANTSSDLDNVINVEMAIIEQLTPIELSVVEIKQSITNTKLTISEKHDLAVSIFEKLGGEVKSYIDEETKSDIVNKLTKKWNSGNQNK
jgi:uncharacterized protein YqeY